MSTSIHAKHEPTKEPPTEEPPKRDPVPDNPPRREPPNPAPPDEMPPPAEKPPVDEPPLEKPRIADNHRPSAGSTSVAAGARPNRSTKALIHSNLTFLTLTTCLT